VVRALSCPSFAAARLVAFQLLGFATKSHDDEMKAVR
jgi:hypothetical protein